MIMLLTGSNAHALKQKAAEVKQKFIKDHGSDGIETFAGEQVDPQALNAIITGVSLFALERLVIINDISANKPAVEKLQHLLDTIPESVHLLLIEPAIDKRTAFYKSLKQMADVHEFAELDEASLVAWTQKAVAKGGGKIDRNIAALLVQHVGTNQLQLANEIEKLCAYDLTITKESIELLVEKKPEDTVFQLLEYALGGKANQALEVLSNLERAHEDPFQIANMLVWQANVLAIIHSAGSTPESEVAKSAKLNPYVVRKTKGLIRTMSKQQLNKILDVVATCDIQLKTTATSPWRLIEQVILSV